MVGALIANLNTVQQIPEVCCIFAIIDFFFIVFISLYNKIK